MRLARNSSSHAAALRLPRNEFLPGARLTKVECQMLDRGEVGRSVLGPHATKVHPSYQQLAPPPQPERHYIASCGVQTIILRTPPGTASMPSASYTARNAGSATVLLRTCKTRPSRWRNVAVTRCCTESISRSRIHDIDRPAGEQMPRGAVLGVVEHRTQPEFRLQAAEHRLNIP